MAENKDRIVSLIIDDVVKSESDLRDYLNQINAELMLKFNEYNKRSELTRLYKADATLLKEASKKTKMPQVQLISLIVRDALLGKRDLNQYLDNLEAELKQVKKWILKK
jgi:hypothetical protein|tara:strand:- start:215 stop:541 length:327 start_codon:yes stop_codon:yes gene_type:complete